jgi:hypothetical protein
VTLALLYEFTGQYKEALDRWTLIKTKEACERTIEILKKAGSKEWIEQYSVWVFERDPELGLKLFTGEEHSDQGPRESYIGVGSSTSASSMPVDDVLVFLEKLQSEPADPRGARAFDQRTKASPALKEYPLI